MSIIGLMRLPLPLSVRRFLGVSVALGVVAAGAGVPILAGTGEMNEDAAKVREASMVVRTNNWLEDRNLDRNSSADMRKALDIACKELKARGHGC